jgi:FkbM family methyltransferase
MNLIVQTYKQLPIGFRNILYILFLRKILGFIRSLSAKEIITKKDIKTYLIRKDPVILEAGACDGRDTVKFAKLFPESKIYAFEPVSANFEVLNRRVKKYPNIKTFKVALSDTNGKNEMNISSWKNPIAATTSDSSSLMKPKEHPNIWSDIVFNTKEVVKTITLDSWAEQENIDHIDIMWLDMQGFEPIVLRASEKIIKTVKIIYTEVCFVELYEGQVLYKEYKNMLNSMGFEVAKEDFINNGANLIVANALFVRK